MDNGVRCIHPNARLIKDKFRCSNELLSDLGTIMAASQLHIVNKGPLTSHGNRE